MNSTDPQPIDYNRKWLVLASVGMGIFLGTIDSSIVNIALPTMVNYFKTDFAIVQWVVLAYLLTLTTLMLSMGRLADMFGKKPIYTLGIVLFTIGSLLCGLSPSIYLLIAARVFQGIGATMVTSLGMAIITESFPGKERGMALGINSAIVSVGIVLGPTLGGFIIQNLSWHWIFFVNLPVGVAGTFMVLRFVPNYKPQGGQKFDYPGSVTLFIGLLSLLIGLTIGQDRGFLEPVVLILFLNSILFSAIFIYIELHSPQPLIEMEYFKSRSLRINLMTRLLSFLSLAGATLLMPFYLENVLGYNPQKAGLMLLVTPITVGIVAPISGTLSDRFGTRTISVIGLGMLVFGAYCITTLNASTTAIGYLLRFIPIGIGSGMFQSPNNSAIMGTAARERLGIMSGIVSISRTLGQTIGIALLGAVWASRTFSHAGKIFAEGATQAPALAQVAGQQDTFRGVIFLLLLGFALGVWGLVDEKHNEIVVSTQVAGK